MQFATRDELLMSELSNTEATILLSSNCGSSCTIDYRHKLNVIVDMFGLTGILKQSVLKDMENYIKARAEDKAYQRRYILVIDEEENIMTLLDTLAEQPM